MTLKLRFFFLKNRKINVFQADRITVYVKSSPQERVGRIKTPAVKSLDQGEKGGAPETHECLIVRMLRTKKPI